MLQPVLYQRSRPKGLDGYVFVDSAMERKFKEWVEKGTLPNLILTGPSGVGKTSLAYALCNELQVPREDILYIKASLSGGIDEVRDRIIPFVETVSHDDAGRFVILDECLGEDEKVRIGTVNEWTAVPLNELERGKLYPIVSFNMETLEYENDSGMVISDKVDEVYEVSLEDGSTVVVTENHPFIIETEDGTIKEKSIKDGLYENDKVVKCNAPLQENRKDI